MRERIFTVATPLFVTLMLMAGCTDTRPGNDEKALREKNQRLQAEITGKEAKIAGLEQELQARDDMDRLKEELERQKKELAELKKKEAANRQEASQRPSGGTAAAPVPARPAASGGEAGTGSPASGTGGTGPAGEPVAGNNPSTGAGQPAAPAPETAAPAAPAEPAKRPVIRVIPAGTALTGRLLNALSSKTNVPADTFQLNLDEAVVVEGETIIPAGARASGSVIESASSGKVKGKARLAIRLDAVEIDGKLKDIHANTLSFEAQGSGKRDAAIIAGGAGLGAIIGGIAGGKKGAAIGAVIGGGAGTGGVLATAGKEVEFPPETRFQFTLERELRITR